MPPLNSRRVVIEILSRSLDLLHSSLQDVVHALEGLIEILSKSKDLLHLVGNIVDAFTPRRLKSSADL